MQDLKYSEEEIAEQGQKYIDQFKEKMKKVADEVLGDIYSNLMPHIESDSWTNYRNYLQYGFSKEWVSDKWRQSYHVELRKQILLEHKAELVPLLNEDLVKRVEVLENELKRTYDRYF